MNVLGIESSCDETAAAIVNDAGEVIADVVASQIAEHAPYGGVVPEIAARSHLKAVLPVIRQACAALPGGLDDVDAIAVTRGPGLVGALLSGLQVAKGLAWSRGLPIVGVNHLDGHLLAAYLREPGEAPGNLKMPYVALLASGGHTAIYRVDAYDDIRMLGQTRDDAAGEGFDKAAKVLGLGYPGGPVIDRLAAQGDPKAVPFPVPMASRKTLDFSFSGLKTSVARHVQVHGIPEGQDLADVCASFQRSVVEVLAKKTIAAAQNEGVRQVVLCGGVAANRGLRSRTKELGEKAGIEVVVPPLSRCTDNAAMIAYAGLLRLQAGERDEAASLGAYSRDPARRRGKFRRDGSHVERKRKPR